MKKQLLSFAVMLSATLFTACINNDNTPNKYLMPIANGVYVVGSGNTANGIPGNLTYYDYSTKTATQDVFERINGASLGNSVLNDAMRYGDKVYVVADGENAVFVADAKTLRPIEVIKLTSDAMLGAGGVSPRRITASENKIYVSTYGGYVAAIDTVNFTLSKRYEVGSYPEGILIVNGYMYVANSDYGQGKASISIINLSTGVAAETITNAEIRNPQEIAVAGADVYYLDYGQYGEAPDYKQEHAGVYRYNLYDKKAVQIIPNATGMTCYGTYIFTFNNANGVEKTTYSVYDIRTSVLDTFVPDGIEIPAAIAIDPVTNYLFIASNTKLSGGQYADYSSRGYVNYYNPSTYQKLGSFDCGVGPVRFAFNNSLEYIEM